MEENSCFPLVMKELPEKFMKIAFIELGETEEKKQKCLKELRKLILEEKGLSCRTDDEFLMIFLRPRKFDVNRTLCTIKNLYKFKLEFDFFRRLENVNSFYDILERKSLTFLQYRDPKGRAIFVFKIRNWNTNEETLDDIISTAIGLIYSTMDYPMTQVNGVVAIIDLKEFTFSHLRHCTPRYIQLIVHGIQECSPLRLKEVHIVKGYILFKYLWMLLKPFLSKKMRNRFLFHDKDMESLHQFIPPSILPPEYGGSSDAPGVTEQSNETRNTENFYLDLMNSGYKEEEQKLKTKFKEQVPVIG